MYLTVFGVERYKTSVLLPLKQAENKYLKACYGLLFGCQFQRAELQFYQLLYGVERPLKLWACGIRLNVQTSLKDNNSRGSRNLSRKEICLTL